MPFRFVHTADVHLDSPLRSLALRHAELAAVIGNATRQAFTNTIDLCLEEAVDALLLVGDLYDGEQTSMKTARFLASELKRLDAAGIRAFIIRGNHDALSKITKELILPDSVKVFGGRAEAVEVDVPAGMMPVVIHGISFTKPQAPDSLLPRFKPAVTGAVNIGLLHTSLAGAPGHDPYSPCSVSDLQANGFQYWALGHIHKRSVIAGDCTVVMPGNPQGRDINEAGSKSVSLVTISDEGTVEVEERGVSIAQFERIDVNVTGIDDWRELVSTVTASVVVARQKVDVRHLVARITLAGETALAWRIRWDLELLKTDLDDRASRAGNCWIEKIELKCHAPGVEARASENPVYALRELMMTQVGDSASFQAKSESVVEDFMRQLPPECRGMFGDNEDEFRARVKDLITEGADDVLARLLESSGGDKQ